MIVTGRPGRRRLGAAVAVLAVSCCLLSPDDRRRVANPSFRTPEETFATLRAAWRCDRPDLEYRCLSESFKEKYGVREETWRLARQTLRRQNLGWRYLPGLRLGPVSHDGPRRARAAAAVGGREAWIEFEREDGFSMRRADGRTVEDFLDEPLDRALVIEGDRATIRLRSALLRDVAPQQVAAVLLEGEWKIADVIVPAEPE